MIRRNPLNKTGLSLISKCSVHFGPAQFKDRTGSLSAECRLSAKPPPGERGEKELLDSSAATLQNDRRRADYRNRAREDSHGTVQWRILDRGVARRAGFHGGMRRRERTVIAADRPVDRAARRSLVCGAGRGEQGIAQIGRSGD